jgi:hypothetical protein
MNNNDGIDDYFDTQLSKSNVRQKPDWAERITRSRARFYQEGMAHGAELERDRIIKLLVKSGWLYNDAEELVMGDQK